MGHEGTSPHVTARISLAHACRARIDWFPGRQADRMGFPNLFFSATDMTLSLSGRVAELGLTLEAAAAAAANYVPFVQDGNLLFISGQISRENGRAAYLGRLGDTISDEDGVRAARLSALGILSQVAAATGDRLDRVARVVRLGVFVACTPD